MEAFHKSKRLDGRELGRLVALPPTCLEVLRRLRQAGFSAYLTGGSARNLLLGRPFLDLDLCTSAKPSECLRILPADWVSKAQPGLVYGSLELVCRETKMELTSFRKDAGYEDGRSPSEVSFVASPQEDHLRRDFTVNALYIDPFECQVLDFCGGLEDLATRRLKTIGDPARRFAEDRLRILRALRFCAELGFVADSGCWSALCGEASRLASLSGFRVLMELQKMFCSKGRARALQLFVASGAAAVLLPELASMRGVSQPTEYHPEGDVLDHTALVLACLPEPVTELLAWAAVFHDSGKPATWSQGPDRIRFYGHAVLSAKIAQNWLADRGADQELVAAVVDVINEHIRICSVPMFKTIKKNRFLAGLRFFDHLAFHRADCLASHANLKLYHELFDARNALPKNMKKPLLRGRDLLAMGIPPGPVIGELLAQVEEARFARELDSVEEAKHLVQEEWQRRLGK